MTRQVLTGGRTRNHYTRADKAAIVVSVLLLFLALLSIARTLGWLG